MDSITAAYHKAWQEHGWIETQPYRYSDEARFHAFACLLHAASIGYVAEQVEPNSTGKPEAWWKGELYRWMK